MVCNEIEEIGNRDKDNDNDQDILTFSLKLKMLCVICILKN